MNMTLILLLPSQPTTESSKAASDPKDDVQRAETAAMVKRVTAKCEFSTDGKTPTKLTQHPDPILRWSNPTTGTVFGEVNVWTGNWRPAVVARLYQWFSPDWGKTLEVSSLSPVQVVGRRGGEFWNPEQPGIKFRPIDETDPPASSAGSRLVQMRRLANGFVA